MRKLVLTFTKLTPHLVFLILLPGCKKDALSIQTTLKTYSSSLQFELLQGSVEKVFSAQMPWESRSLSYYNILRTGTSWRMWYNCFGSNQYNFEGSFCFAISTDGKNWQRPLTTGNTNVLVSGNNATGITGTFVFVDSLDRFYPYKMICSKRVNGEQTTYLYSSRDGKSWKDYRLLYNLMQDSQFGVVEINRRYYIFSRYNDYSHGYQRAIGLSILDSDLKSVQQPLLLLEANSNSDFPHIYNSAASKINDSTVLLFPTYFNEEHNTIRLKMIYTNDMRDYYLINDDITDILFPNKNVNWAIVSPGVIPADQENTYWVYYYGTDARHDGFNYLSRINVTYYRIKLVVHQ